MHRALYRERTGPSRSKGSALVAKIFGIFEGTEKIQQLVIGRAISGLRIE